MKTKNALTETTPLWQLAEHNAQAELEPTGPPLAAEFSVLSELLTNHPKLIEQAEMGGETVELTPKVRYITLAEASESAAGLPAKSLEQSSVTLLPDESTVPGSLIAQAHRVKDSPMLYLALSSGDLTEHRQFTIHDGHVTDLADSNKELSDDEITAVKTAMSAISEKVQSDFEIMERQRISKKIGAWWSDSDGRRAERRAERRMRREIRWQSLGEVGTDV